MNISTLFSSFQSEYIIFVLIKNSFVSENESVENILIIHLTELIIKNLTVRDILVKIRSNIPIGKFLIFKCHVPYIQ